MKDHSITRRTALKSIGTTIALTTSGVGFPGILRAADTVKIGFLAPLTGPVANLGINMRDTVQLAVEEVNAQGGAGGRKMELIIEDDQMSPKVTVDKIRRLIFKDKVDVIMGLATGAEMIPARAVSRKANQLMITFTTQDSFPPPCYKLQVNHGITINQFIDPLAEWAVKNLGKKIFFCGTDDIWSHNHAKRLKEMMEKLGGQFVGEEYFPYATQDFVPTIRRIKKAKPDALYVVLSDDISIIMRQLRDFGVKTPIICPILNETYAEAVGDAAEGTIVCSTYFMSVDTPENKALLARMKLRYPEQIKGRPGETMVMAHAEGTYTAVYQYKLAIEMAGSMDKEKVLKAITQVKFTSPQGPLVMAKNLHRAHNMRIARFVKDAKADFGYRADILQEFGQITPIVPLCDA